MATRTDRRWNDTRSTLPADGGEVVVVTADGILELAWWSPPDAPGRWMAVSGEIVGRDYFVRWLALPPLEKVA